MLDTRHIEEELIDILLHVKTVPESASLDYKVKLHEAGHDCELFKDVLALANSYDNPDEDRWLIYGVDDKHHELIGVDASSGILDDASYQEKFLDKVKERITFVFVSIPANRVGLTDSQNKVFAAFYIPKKNSGILHELSAAVQDKNEDKRTHKTIRYEAGTSFVRIGSSTKPMTEEHRMRIRELGEFRSKQPTIAYRDMKRRAPITAGVERLRLLGAWNGDNENDRAIVAGLYGSTYEEAIDALKDELDAGLFTIEGSVWKVRDRIAALESVGGHLTSPVLDQLTKAFTDVFESVDEALRMPAESRLIADVKGVERGCSPAIRSGAAAFFACLANNRALAPHCKKRQLDHCISSVICTVIGAESWEIIASNEMAIPLLAEASPSLYLNAVSGAMKDSSALLQYLKESTGGVISIGYGQGLVQGIRFAAMKEGNLSQSIGILARLLPHTTLAKDAIVSILLPWMPMTDAPVSSRVGMAKYLAGCGSDEAWSTLLELLPNRVSSSIGTEPPQFLGVGDLSKGVTVAEYWEASRGYCRCAIEGASADINRMVDIGSRIDSFIAAGLLDECLKAFRVSDFAKQDSDRYRIWNELSDYATRCERYPDAKWVPEDKTLDELRAFISEICPIDPYYIALRSCSTPDFKLCIDSTSGGLRGKALSMRVASVRDACNVACIGVVDRMVKDGALPYLLGEALGYAELTEDEQDYLLSYMDEMPVDGKLMEVASVFAWSRFKREQWAWIDSLDMEGWPSNRAAGLFSAIPVSKEAWTRVEALLESESDLYWSRIRDSYSFENAQDLDYCVGKLLAVGRPNEALTCVHDAIDAGIAADSETVLRVLEASGQSPKGALSDYHIEELFKYVESIEESDRLWLLELQFSALLVDRKDSYLFRRLCADPNAFMTLIQLAYGAPETFESGSVPKSETRWLIHNRVLGEWVIVPGYGDDGVFSPETFSEWLGGVKVESEQAGLSDAAEWEIGRNLFHAGPGDSGLFVPVEVMEYLNSNACAREGYEIESVNSRGAHFVDNTGAQEDAIAQSFDDKALVAEERGYIHFAVTLRTIAREYRSEAEENRENG